MGTALFTAVTGLAAHQSRMDVVANNISNVSTVGYRGSRADFQDVLSETLEAGSAANGNYGGSNPMQIGLGVTLGGITVNQTQGSVITTGVASDLMIDGNGFFILSDGTKNLYTRDGSFDRNTDGVLIDPASGLKVQGWTADSDGKIDTNVTVSDVVIPEGSASIVKATQNAYLVGNLDSDAATGTTVVRTFRVYDSLGAARDVQVTFTKHVQITDNGTTYNTWKWKAEYGTGNDVTNVNSGESGVLLFDTNGVFQGEGSLSDADTYTARSALASQNEVSIPATLITDASQPVTPIEFSMDFSKLTSLSADSDASLNNQDGFARGVLQDFSVGTDGVITGEFSNGLTKVIGQVALASFGNVGGLSRSGSNAFVETASSGPAQIGAAKTGGRGSINGGELEGSNVDLATEFSNMILTQRGYQANARTITAADTLIQETVNLVR